MIRVAQNWSIQMEQLKKNHDFEKVLYLRNFRETTERENFVRRLSYENSEERLRPENFWNDRTKKFVKTSDRPK